MVLTSDNPVSVDALVNTAEQRAAARAEVEAGKVAEALISHEKLATRLAAAEQTITDLKKQLTALQEKVG